MRRLSAALILTMCCAVSQLPRAGAQEPGGDESLRRRYDSGLALLRQGDYLEALAHFQAIVDDRARIPGSELVPAALYQAGETLRLGKRREEAVARYRQVSIDFPRSSWAAVALMGEARCLVADGRAPQAMDRLQRVRDRFPGTSQAARAIALNTVLYRLYVRAPVQPPYQVAPRSFSGPSGKLKGIEAIAAGDDGRVLAAGDSAVLTFDSSGVPLTRMPAAEPRGVSFDGAGQPVVVQKGGVVVAGRAMVLAAGRQDGPPKPLKEIAAAVLAPAGHLLVADRGAKSITRFSADGKYIGQFAQVDARRLAVDAAGVAAAIEDDTGAVVILEADGLTRARLPRRGQGYVLERASDLAFDAFGHLYVLDRGQGGVVVFLLDPLPTVVATFVLLPGTPGSLRKATALALDAAGRLFVYDDDAGRIQVYQ